MGVVRASFGYHSRCGELLQPPPAMSRQRASNGNEVIASDLSSCPTGRLVAARRGTTKARPKRHIPLRRSCTLGAQRLEAVLVAYSGTRAIHSDPCDRASISHQIKDKSGRRPCCCPGPSTQSVRIERAILLGSTNSTGGSSTEASTSVAFCGCNGIR